ncbi:hypothetical protein Taro_042175, partial [Colocasia esculenta]|nr:hypothetical protein [Colocasia esculenta]
MDVNPKSAVTSMDANPNLAASDVDVRLPDLLRFQIQNASDIIALGLGNRSPMAMASRGRRGVPARGDEQRGEERVEPRRGDHGEQQAPVPQGPVLPPPPPVDYGVFMQGLAQVPVPQPHDHGGPSIMEKFKRMAPPSFKGESDLLLAESWMREIEKIFRAIRCAEDDKVTLATYMLQERADVWWSSLLRTRFEDGAVEVAWDEFVRLFRAKFV